MVRKESEVTPVTIHMDGRNYTGAFVTVALMLAFLFVANLYTLGKLNSSREDARSVQQSLREEIKEAKAQNQDLLLKVSTLRSVQAREIDQLRAGLDAVTDRFGSTTGQALNRARSMLIAIKKGQTLQSNSLQREISRKADTDDLDAVIETASSTQSELGTTQRTVDVLARDLGAASAELGGLVASAHDQIQALHQLSERKYYDFTLSKNEVHRIAGIGVSLILKKTDVKGQRFSLNLVANDQQMQNKGRTIYEPIFFYVGGLRVPCELVITGVGSDTVAGYITAPKAAVQENGLVPRT